MYRRLYALEIKPIAEDEGQYIIYDDLWLLDIFQKEGVIINGDYSSFLPLTCRRVLTEAYSHAQQYIEKGGGLNSLPTYQIKVSI